MTRFSSTPRASTRLGNLFAAVALATLAGCGGGGSSGGASAPTPAPAPAPAAGPVANPTINATTSYRLSNTPAPTDIAGLLAAAGIFGQYFDARQYVDLDGDGVKEIVVAPGRDSTDATPSRVFRKGSDGLYTDQTAAFYSGAIPGLIHPRKVISADFNGDGRADLYFIDHGYDHNPFPGAQNVLALSDAATGKLAIKAIPGNAVSFQHCGTAGDIDNNGSVDIFACSDGWQTTASVDKSSYFLLNDGAGNMTISRAGIPASIKGGGMLAAELIDVDGDGFLELIVGHRHYNAGLGRNEARTTVFWGDGTGAFTDARSLLLPVNATFNTTYDIKAEDVDGDGRRDIVLLSVRENLTGYYVHIFRQTAARTFADESLARIIKDEASWEGKSADWFPWIHVTDLNADGKPDIAIGDSSGHAPARDIRWINDGSSVFTRAQTN